MFYFVERLRRLPAGLMWRGRRLMRTARLSASMRRVHGPSRFDLAPDDVVVVVLVRDSRFYLEKFLEHHRSLGVRHFVFVDNGSTDGTPERLRSEPDCITLRTGLSFYHNETMMRDIAARRYAGGHWVLFVDSDEMFDFSGSDVLGLSGLARYLTERGHTAMVAQMLEMFPKGPIADHASKPFDVALDTYSYYDLSAVISYDYHNFPMGWSGFANLNRVVDDRVKLMTGGVRAKVFNEKCGLSKHPLVFLGENVQGCAHPHCAANVTISDITGVLRHYKFTNRFLERDRSVDHLKIGNIGEAKARVDGLANDPDLSLFSDDALDWDGVDALYEQGFLVQSDEYAAYLAAQRNLTESA